MHFLDANFVCLFCCRALDTAKLEEYASNLAPAIPYLLDVVRDYHYQQHRHRVKQQQQQQQQGQSTAAAAAGGGGDGSPVPLVFFAVSTLVRMTSCTALAKYIVYQGGVKALVPLLDPDTAPLCQVRGMGGGRRGVNREKWGEGWGGGG